MLEEEATDMVPTSPAEEARADVLVDAVMMSNERLSETSKKVKET
jgi:hypothetical protein